jgi:translation elongation factor P/translation initiation factor 5A
MNITHVNQIHVNTKDNVTGLLVPHTSVNVPVITREQTVNVSYHSVHSFLFIDNRSWKKKQCFEFKTIWNLR